MKGVKIAVSVVLIIIGSFLWKKGYDMGAKPMFVGMVGFSGGGWKGNMMTMDEYERYIETDLKRDERVFNEGFSNSRNQFSLVDGARKKLNDAKSKQSLLEIGGILLSLIGIGILISIWLLKTKPENEDEGLPTDLS